MAKKKKPTGAAAIKTIEDSATPAGPKPGERGFKTSAIKAYHAANPGVGPTKIAEALTAQFKEEFSPSLVSNILGGGNKPKGKPGRKPKGEAGAAPVAKQAAQGSIEAAMTLVTTAGGIEQAKAALKTLEAFAKTVGG